MKKLLSLLVMLLAFTASGFAETYYVVGGMNGGFTYEPGKGAVPAMELLAGTEDTYYADFVVDAGDQYFCIADGDGTGWDDFNTNNRYSSAVANQDVSAGCYSVALGKNGDRSLKITGDGTTKYRIMFVESTKKLTVTKVGLEYVVAGSFTPDGGAEEANFFGTAWATSASANKLTLQNDGTYAITFSKVPLSKGTITYKIAAYDGGGAWGTATATNQTYNITATSEFEYDITFTFYINNIDGPVCTCVAGKSFDVTPSGTTIWSDAAAHEIDWESGKYVTLANSLFATAKVGDILHIAMSYVNCNAGEWGAQVAIQSSWKNLEGATAIGLGTISDVSIVLTGDMLANIKANGAIVTGQRYTTKLVTLESCGESALGTDNSIWVGNADSYTTVNSAHFNNAHAFAGVEAGDVIKVTVKEQNAEGKDWMIFKYSGSDTGWEWKDYKDLAAIDGTYVESDNAFYFVVKSAHVDQMKLDGVIVNHGDKWTVTQVELLPNSGYTIVMDAGAGWVAGDAMTEDGDDYKATITGAAYFAMIQNNALNAAGTGIATWGGVIRPNSVDNFLVNFQNYADAVGETTKVWAINAAAGIKDVNIVFTPSTGDYTLSCTGEVEIGETGYATYSNDNMYQVEGATANFVTVAGDVATLVAQDADAILPAKGANGKGAGIVLTGEKNSKATIKSVASDASAVDNSANLMAGSGNSTYDISGDFGGGVTYTGYILANHESVLGFYQVKDDDNTLAAHKAFLAVPDATAPSFIGFGADVTGINEVKGSGLKVQDAVVYDLQGRRVITPARGLYIVNGRKVVIK